MKAPSIHNASIDNGRVDYASVDNGSVYEFLLCPGTEGDVQEGGFSP